MQEQKERKIERKVLFMKYYDAKKIKTYIDSHKGEIKSVTLGMREDWDWTADEVFHDGKFLVPLDGKTVNIAGIDGSIWATPVMEVDFKDGRTEIMNAFYGDGKGASVGAVAQAKQFAAATGGMDYKE